jgi:hypothetical protein
MIIGAVLSGVAAGVIGAKAAARTAAQPGGLDKPAGPTSSAQSDSEDRVELSPAAQRDGNRSGESDRAASIGRPTSVDGKPLAPQQAAQIQKLKDRDATVRKHEAAHIAAGGPYVHGGAHFEYQSGPDGHAYAVGGEVSIDTSPIPHDPAATIAKMEVVRAAALAPADPSDQDRQVATEATAAIQQAQTEESQAQAESVAGGAAPPVGSASQRNNAGDEPTAAGTSGTGDRPDDPGTGPSPVPGPSAPYSARHAVAGQLDLVA